MRKLQNAQGVSRKYVPGDHTGLEIDLELAGLDPSSQNFAGTSAHYGEDGRSLEWIDANSETTAVVLVTLTR